MDHVPMSRVEVQQEAEKLNIGKCFKAKGTSKDLQETANTQSSAISETDPLLPSPCLDKKDSQEKGRSRSEKMVSYKSTTSLFSPPSLCPPVLGNLWSSKTQIQTARRLLLSPPQGTCPSAAPKPSSKCRPAHRGAGWGARTFSLALQILSDIPDLDPYRKVKSALESSDSLSTTGTTFFYKSERLNTRLVGFEPSRAQP